MKNESPLDQQFEDRIARLERMVEALMGSNNIRNTTITAPGKLRVLKANGTLDRNSGDPVNPDPDSVLYAGILPDVVGGGKAGLLVRREDGTFALVVGAQSGAYQYLAIQDRTGNVIISDDALSGGGIARPYIPMNFSDGNSAHWGSTTSATFVSLYTHIGFRMQPKLYGVVQVLADAGTSGELQLWDGANNVQLALATIGVAESSYKTFGAIDISSAASVYGGMNLQLRARRTAGTGSIYICPVHIAGYQS